MTIVQLYYIWSLRTTDHSFVVHFLGLAKKKKKLNPFKTCQVIVHFWTMFVIKALHFLTRFAIELELRAPGAPGGTFFLGRFFKPLRSGLTFKIHLAFQLF